MKTKPPKSAAGVTAVISTDDKPAYDPLLYTRQYNNGHKFFNASEAKALTELLHTETSCRENFSTMRSKMVKPRNPLTGGVTPRDIRGEVVINPNAHGRVVNGEPLFTERSQSDSQEIARKFAPKGTVGKIGVNDTNYDILGNREPFGYDVSSQPENLFMHTQTQHRAKTAAMRERETINSFILKEKAKRREKELAREVTTLRLKAAEKERELEFLQQQSFSSRY